MPIRRKIRSLMLILLLMVPTTGCYDKVELEALAFVTTMGLDKGPDDTIDVTVRIVVPGKIVGGPGGGGGGGGKEEALSGAKPITVRAHTITEALTLINTAVERRISLTHLADILIGESLAKEGLSQYLLPIFRFREFRRTVGFLIVKGNTRELLENNKPLLERTASRFVELRQEVGKHTGLSAGKKFQEIIVVMESANQDTIVPVATINQLVKQKAGSDGEKEQKWTKEQAKQSEISYKPGEVMRLGGNPFEEIGAAVFRKDRMVALLDGIDLRMLLIIRGEMRRMQMDFADPLQKGQFVSVELKHARSPIIDADLNANPIRIKIKQRLEGDLLGASGKVDYSNPVQMNYLEDAIRKRLEDRQKALVERIYHEYQSEPFTVFKRLRGKFDTLDEIKQYDFREKLKDAEVAVEIDLQLRRVGVQFTPFEAR